MRYMALIYTNPVAYTNMSEEEQGAEYQAYMNFNKEAEKRDAMRDAVQLHPASTATTVRVRDGKTSTFDGPFAETKEYLGGVYILECENLDDAIELAAMIPAAKHSSVEVRPVMETHA